MDIKIYQGIAISIMILFVAVSLLSIYLTIKVIDECKTLGGTMVDKFGRPCVIGNDTYVLEKFKWVKS